MGFLRRHILHDIGLKLFSLLMAICLWAVVSQDRMAGRATQNSLDIHKTRVVEVRPRVVGQLVSGYSITKVVVDPPQVRITGPSNNLNLVDAAVTDPIDATGLISQHTFTAKTYVIDPLVQVVNPAPVRVTVFVAKSGGRGN